MGAAPQEFALGIVTMEGNPIWCLPTLLSARVGKVGKMAPNNTDDYIDIKVS